MSLQFVDTSVLLYAYDTTAGEKHEQALALVGPLGRTRSGASSVQVLQEFYVNAVRKIAEPLPTAVARERVKRLALWPTHSPTTNDVLAATNIAERERLSFWDAMIIRSASVLGCQVLWTEDLNPGQVVDGVRIANPFAGA